MVSGSAGYAWVQDPVWLGAAPVQLDTVKLKKFRKSSARVRFEPKKWATLSSALDRYLISLLMLLVINIYIILIYYFLCIIYLFLFK
jgi:hypothetical protein